MKLQPGEYVIWKDYSYSYLGALALAGLIFGAILILTEIFTALGVVIIVVSVVLLILIMANEYVVTNKRAMHVRFGKVWKQVDLSTPGLVVSTVNPKTGDPLLAQDVVFIVKGVEVLRFSNISKGDELMVKLRSLRFP